MYGELETKAFREKLPLQGVISLVLHRIVRGVPGEWEDVHEDRLRNILAHVGDRWAVLRKDGCKEDSRWMLTFDDGFLSDYEIVFPMLQEHGISATFFIITDRVGDPGYLNWSQINEMNRHGMCIGSHSRTHRRLTGLPVEEASFELSESKKLLEDRMGSRVDAFSYPFGEHSPLLHELGLSEGYQYLCTSDHGMGRSGCSVIPRNSIFSAMDSQAISNVMEPVFSRQLRWQVEDVVKQKVKSILGHDRYTNWRNKLFRG